MPDKRDHLDHLFVVGYAGDVKFTRSGRGNRKIREVDRQAHGERLITEIGDAFAVEASLRGGQDLPEELLAKGTIITLEGSESTFLLNTNTLDYTRRRKAGPRWVLRSVDEATDGNPEHAVVWVSDDSRDHFLKLFQDYLDKETKTGNPQNNELVANISRIRHTIVEDLWTSDGDPPRAGVYWWELWLRADEEALRRVNTIVKAHGLGILPRATLLKDRTVVWIQADWSQLELLVFSRVEVAEIRRPAFVDTVEDLSISEQQEHINDLVERVIAADDDAPAVCILDTGVFRLHQLICESLAEEDHHSVVGESGNDADGHGTSMAGLALFGDLDKYLVNTAIVALRHRLESVRLMPYEHEKRVEKLDFGTATATAAAQCEVTRSRSRVFCLALSSKPDKPGEPTLWSATIDALAMGTDVIREGDQLQLLSEPDPALSRLFVVSAGNVDHYSTNHRLESETSGIEDPAQSWNALTVGAFTDRVELPSAPQYAGWTPVARKGDLSPHSRTSVTFAQRKTPIKPDICMEGGNVLTDGQLFEDRLPLLSLRSLGIESDLALASANATSAAVAQAARLAALAMDRYPDYWPETIRGLLTHAARWTPVMQAEVDSSDKKGDVFHLLRQFGWGVPTEDAVLNSSGHAVTLVAQDQFVPFEGPKRTMPRLRLHEMPWPKDVLEQLEDEEVRLRVTLSYFIEPTASRRGWRNRYSYASHALRFDVQGQSESRSDFIARVNRQAGAEVDDEVPSDGYSSRWTVGERQRVVGSLHQDDWIGSGAQLAGASSIAIYPVGGWWKNNSRSDRVDTPVRYSLIVSLKTPREDVDLYTPIETQLKVPTQTVIEW